MNTDIKAWLRQWEGEKLTAYLDGAGILTVGVGHKCLPEDNLQENDTITQEQCDEFLDQDIKIASDEINNDVGRGISNNALCALISLGFNIGVRALRDSTLMTMLKQGYMQGAAQQFLRWDKMHVNGEVVESQGLLNRRRAESALFLTDEEA